ncbi:MAG TPA: molybdopterin molybdotransferase MoeA [Steroidobacteraceae bacterium]|nr:molybdopterin molybdotransferase MoeA [Steroidobacteraceae bacterium]
MTPAEAAAVIAAAIPPLPVEPTPLASVTGRVLRQEIAADRDQPPFHRVAMDGIAVDSATVAAGRREFVVAGTQAAGEPQRALPSTDSCFEVMTGAVLPAGCDCVIPVERVRIEGAAATIVDEVEATPWRFIHARGADCRAGDRLISPGVRLGPAEMAVLAASGHAHVATARPPSILIVSTGNELVEPGEPVEDWQIRSSNGYTLTAALRQYGFDRTAQDRLPDDEQVLRERLATHLDTHDVLILSGGVSMGRFDFIPATLTALGVERRLHGIAQRPGRPMWFGVRAPDKTVFALPGNPVSALVCCVRYVVPALLTAMGARTADPERLALETEIAANAALTLFLPVERRQEPTGLTVAVPRPTRGSGDFTSLLGTDGFVELPAGARTLPAGTVVDFHPWRAR